MKLCLLLLLAAASLVLAVPVPRRKIHRAREQSELARLLPIAIFNNGVTTTVAPAAGAAAVAAATASGAAAAATPDHGAAAAATPDHGAAAAAATPDHGAAAAATPAAAPHSAAIAVPPTRNFLGAGQLQPIPVANLPPAADLAAQPNVGIPALPTLHTLPTLPTLPALPTLPNALAGIANFLNPFRLLSLNNIFNALPLPRPPVVNPVPLEDADGISTGVYIWTPATGAVPYNPNNNRKRLIDEPEQIDPNYLNLMQQMYYSSLQNPQRSSYLPPQFSSPMGYQNQLGYTLPFQNVNPYSQPPQMAAYPPYVVPSYYSGYPQANNPYYPMYLIKVQPPNSGASGAVQNPSGGVGSAGITQEDESEPGISTQQAVDKINEEIGETTGDKPETEVETSSGSEVDPNQESGMEQGTTPTVEMNQQPGKMDSNANSSGSESQPSNVRGNSKFYVKFSRDPSNQQRRVYQRPQARSDVPLVGNHGPLVSSYRLRQPTTP